MSDETLETPTPGNLDEQLAMARRQAARGVPGAQVDVTLLEELRDGKLTVEQAAEERPKRLAMASRPNVQASAPRSYPDAISDPVDPPTVSGTDIVIST